jgi:hypothetical protein
VGVFCSLVPNPLRLALANPYHLASKIRGAHPSLKTLTVLGVSTVTCGAMAW